MTRSLRILAAVLLYFPIWAALLIGLLEALGMPLRLMISTN